MRWRAVALIGILSLLGGCATTPVDGSAATATEEVPTMQLTSSAFADGEAIPSEHTCDGADRSPPLAWSDVPGGTDAFALLVEDPDARDFVHWVLVDVPGDRRALAAGEGDAAGTPGRNDFGRIGWGGPCPPSGEHRYVFTIWALPATIGAMDDAGALRSAAESNALASATLTGVYRRA